MQLRNKLDNILKEYIRLFEEKHEVFFDYAVGDDLTGLLCFGDYLFTTICPKTSSYSGRMKVLTALKTLNMQK